LVAFLSDAEREKIFGRREVKEGEDKEKRDGPKGANPPGGGEKTKKKTKRALGPTEFDDRGS